MIVSVELPECRFVGYCSLRHKRPKRKAAHNLNPGGYQVDPRAIFEVRHIRLVGGDKTVVQGAIPFTPIEHLAAVQAQLLIL